MTEQSHAKELSSRSKSSRSSSWGLHWFRRDLRVAGNPSLRWSWKQHQGRVLGFFCFDQQFLSRADFSHNRFAFFLKTLRALKAELQAAGGDLLVLDQGPQASFEALFAAFSQAKVALPATVSWNRDYEPFARARDAEISQFLQQQVGLVVHTEADHLLLEPGEVQKPTGGDYTVYSPFARQWFVQAATPRIQARLQAEQEGLAYLRAATATPSSNPTQARFLLSSWPALLGDHLPLDHLERFWLAAQERCEVPLPEAGSLAALATLRNFKPKLDQYQEQRDLPAVEGTSRLSIYLKNGSLSSSQVLAFLGLEQEPLAAKNGRTTFVKELAWREFYYHLLWQAPRVEHEAFQVHYKDLKWENREDWFQAWKAGQTGYPVVDAGMRQLLTTGWMHNRVRMIVASFLTKDLLIDWRWGERYFMEKLLDGDLAANNGGWQWAASTGCDAQPYFRIFNPTLQGLRFDPDGHYVRHFVPELRGLSTKQIYDPEFLRQQVKAYPSPVVNHAEQKVKALALFKR